MARQHSRRHRYIALIGLARIYGGFPAKGAARVIIDSPHTVAYRMYQSKQPGRATLLGQWIAGHDAGFNEHLLAEEGSSGFTWRTDANLTEGTVLVSCPLDHVVTPSLCRAALASFVRSPEQLSNRQVMSAYLALHKSEKNHQALKHQHYVDSLPTSATLRSPLFFNEEELESLRGTNLFGATLDRSAEWQRECDALASAFVNKENAPAWADYLWAATMLSSRAFSSTLLPSTHPDAADATPILIPGVDVLDHDPKAKVLWQTDVDKGTIAIHADAPIAAGAEVLNNYGPKPNEELALGYGFAFERNDADIVALKLVVPPSYAALAAKLGLKTERHLINRYSGIPDELLAVVRLLVSDEQERAHLEQAVGQEGHAEVTWREYLRFIGPENELDALETLTEMLDARLLAVKQPRDLSVFTDELKARMVQYYINGQAEVLESALASCEKLMEDAMEQAATEPEDGSGE